MYGTAIQVARQAAIELGLPVPTELVTSLEVTSVQLLGLLTAAGNELVQYYDWEFLLKTHSFTSTAGENKYDRPADFGRMINQTLWDKSMRRPAYGPLSPQSWQVLTNAVVMAGPFSRYRIAGGKVEVLPVPGGSDHEFNFQYISNGWVQSYLDPNAFSGFITNDSDTLLFDFWLLVKFLKLKMWQAKGLDTTSLNSDFTRTFDACTGQDHGAPILNLSRTRNTPFLTMGNVQDGAWNVGNP